MNLALKACIAAALAAGATLLAQSSSNLSTEVQKLAKTPAAERFDQLARIWNELTADLLARVSPQSGREPDRAAAVILARRRSDIQNGAGAGAAASTSAVLNPLLPAAFGFAFENGSIVRTVSGNSVTISINPAGLLCASRSEIATVTLRQPGCFDAWRRFGATASFDTGRGDAPASATGLRPLSNQFAEATLRYEILNQRKPGNASFERRVEDWKKNAKAAANAINVMEIKLRPLRREMEQRLLSELDSATFAALPASRRIDVLQGIVDDTKARLPASDDIIREADAAWRDLLRASNSVYNSFAHGWVVTAEYAFERPDIASAAIGTIVPQGTRPPNLHTARLVLARGLTAYNFDFTVNASASWFQQRRPGMTSLFRDVQFSGDAKLRLRDIPDFGAPVLSLAGLWIHLNQRPLGIQIPTFVGTNINDPGNIGVFQTKLEIPTANAAVRIPISFTYANRTDLIKESDVRGQIGISLNLDSLFADPSKK